VWAHDAATSLTLPARQRIRNRTQHILNSQAPARSSASTLRCSSSPVPACAAWRPRLAAGPGAATRGRSGAARAGGGRWCGRTAPHRAAAAARHWLTPPRAPWSACSPAADPAAPRAPSRTTSAGCPRRAGAPALPRPRSPAGAALTLPRAAAACALLQARRGARIWRPRQVASSLKLAASRRAHAAGRPSAFAQRRLARVG
jgi:hypothetical protein